MSKQPQKRNRTSWQPGQSGNPRGRPRTGLALAEAIREDLDPKAITALAVRVLHDEDQTPAQRLHVLMPFVQLGFAKPPTTMSLDVSTSSSIGERAYDELPLDERLAILEKLDSAPRVTDPRTVGATAPNHNTSPTTAAEPPRCSTESPTENQWPATSSEPS